MRLVPLLALALAAPLAAEERGDPLPVDRSSAEYAFALCVNQKDPSLLYAMRDADSQEGFREALTEALALCEADMSGSFSLGRFFNAVASFIGKPEYDDAKVEE